MTTFRRHALVLFAASTLAALLVVGSGLLVVTRTIGLTQALGAPDVTCGCRGIVGITSVNTPTMLFASVLSLGFLTLVAVSVFRAVRLYQRTQHVRVHSLHSLGVYTVGFFHPHIVFPRGEQARFTGEERVSIRAHEAAHVRWHDPLLFFLLSIALSLFAWAPGIHRIERRFRLLVELDADEAVIHATGTRKPLGTALLKSVRSPSVALDPVAVSFFSATEARLRRIVRLRVPLPLSALALPAIVVTLTVAGFLIALPRVSAKTVPSTPRTVTEYLQCAARPQCMHEARQTAAPRTRPQPAMSFIIIYE